jgi:hypothetical protein
MYSDKDDVPEVLRWFAKSHPIEHYLSNEVAKRLDEIYSNFSDYHKDIEQRPIYLAVQKDENRKPAFITNVEGAVFLGVIAKTALDIASSGYNVEELTRKATREYLLRINPLLYQNLKRCPICNYENEYGARFCNQCAAELLDNQ